MNTTKIQKNEEYSKLLRDVGSKERVDQDDPDGTNIELPSWVDTKKVAKGQLFTVRNLHSNLSSIFATLVMIACIPSILKILKSTKKSSTIPSAFRRYRMTAVHGQIWASGPIEPGSHAWKSLEITRKIHININKRAIQTGSGFITQKDMALTHFLHIGFQASGSFFRMVGSDEDFENYNHFVRLIGHMLGIKDEFNCCGATYAETLGRLEALKEDFFKPIMTSPTDEYLEYAEVACKGMWYLDPTLNFESTMWQIKRALRIPGYYYFESERLESDEPGSNMKILEKLSLYTRFRIFMSVITFEYLNQFFITRWMLIIMRMSFKLLEIFPILLIAGFGWDFAMAERRKKTTFY